MSVIVVDMADLIVFKPEISADGRDFVRALESAKVSAIRRGSRSSLDWKSGMIWDAKLSMDWSLCSIFCCMLVKEERRFGTSDVI